MIGGGGRAGVWADGASFLSGEGAPWGGALVLVGGGGCSKIIIG